MGLKSCALLIVIVLSSVSVVASERPQAVARSGPRGLGQPRRADCDGNFPVLVGPIRLRTRGAEVCISGYRMSIVVL